MLFAVTNVSALYDRRVMFLVKTPVIQFLDEMKAWLHFEHSV